ncbi:hypothetical protein Pcinc_014826 [Petrolisthes cinctipes]|uniref:PiggyBac transposable element-derived protein domain-containing protein n=1 Tax=Petrolisthes cinctipes TaxID=88211 RepID=A0AAE1FZI8_PETCI|nr:hypothetical protein Pcinc_014826 [Petrolisthes cinctipes]
MCALYSRNRKTRRWPLYTFYWMVNAAVINSMVVHTAYLQRTGRTKIPKRRRFMLLLARQFIRPWAEKRLSSATLPRPLRVLISSSCDLPSVASTQNLGAQVLAKSRYPQIGYTVQSAPALRTARHASSARCVRDPCASPTSAQSVPTVYRSW